METRRCTPLAALFGLCWVALPTSSGCSRSPSEPSGPRSNTEERGSPTAPPASDPGPAPQDARGSTVADETDPCARLREQGTYLSREELDCGPPIDEHPPARCRSRLTFSEEGYQWRHTDMVFTGEYTCRGLLIEAEEHSGKYDPATGHVHWEGMEYLPAARP